MICFFTERMCFVFMLPRSDADRAWRFARSQLGVCTLFSCFHKMLTQPDALVIHRMYVLCCESRLTNKESDTDHVSRVAHP
ncbi:hypothetical protein PILCRDRAFT_112110 [Piloderma croceum F 1598]|uniref:Uncharacterized protein n=1 Tax=Piloderma croceum (strain F 1598) TaxID=765440 RepID=A0A0C3CR59_PILCF|nr:hypothetical protein PILCRDRAFT_112110 [Piloderma croceum F 1598]